METKLAGKASGTRTSTEVLQWLQDALPATLASVATLIVWELTVRGFAIPPYILPGPSAIATALAAGFKSGVLLDNAMVTLTEALAGFAVAIVAAVVLGILMAEIRFLELALNPLVSAFQAVPKLALAPLLVIWFGFGLSSKIVMSSLAAFFPIFINTVVGLKQVEPARLDLMRVIKATRFQTLWLLKIPSALSYIFAGLSVAAIFALLGAIVGEYSGATKGLGFFIVQLNSQLDMPGVFSALVILAAIGTAMDLLIRWIHRTVVFWAQPMGGKATKGG